MSLTSYRAAPPRVNSGLVVLFHFERLFAFIMPGGALLSRVLRQSTIGAGAFHGRVRDGIGWGRPAIATGQDKSNWNWSVFFAISLSDMRFACQADLCFKSLCLGMA